MILKSRNIKQDCKACVLSASFSFGVILFVRAHTLSCEVIFLHHILLFSNRWPFFFLSLVCAVVRSVVTIAVTFCGYHCQGRFAFDCLSMRCISEKPALFSGCLRSLVCFCCCTVADARLILIFLFPMHWRCGSDGSRICYFSVCYHIICII